MLYYKSRFRLYFNYCYIAHIIFVIDHTHFTLVHLGSCWFNLFGCDDLGFVMTAASRGSGWSEFLGLVWPNNGITFNKQTETDRKQDTPPLVVTIHSLSAMPATLPLILAVAAVKCLAECQTEETNLLSCWGSWTWQRLCLNNAFWTILLSFTMIYFGTNSFSKEFFNIS